MPLDKRIRSRIQLSSTELLLIGAVVLYIVVFSVLSVMRYRTFHAMTLDLGIMTQVVWNSAHGRYFETSLGRFAGTDLMGNYLGNHVRPFLLFLAPLYRLWPDPALLLILQSVALGLAAVPLYGIAKRLTGDSKAACVVALCYLAYPALGFLNLVDFHPIAFSILFVFAAYQSLQVEKRWLFWIFVLLALSTKEEMAIPIAIWGGVTLLNRERRRLGLALLSLAGGWAVLSLFVIIPYFNDGQPYRFWTLWSFLPDFFSPESIAESTIRPIFRASPQTVILFLLHLGFPLGFLPFLGPASLVVALPSLVYLLLGERPALHSVGYHYPAVLIPWLFLATAEGLSRLRRSGRWRRVGLAFLVMGALGINIPLNPILLYSLNDAFQPLPHHEQIVEALARIPPDAGVATINSLGPPLANRRILVGFEYPPPFQLDHVRQVDYVLLDLVDCRYAPGPDQRAEYAKLVTQVLETRLFGVDYWSDRILLLKRENELSEMEGDAIIAYIDTLLQNDRPCWP